MKMLGVVNRAIHYIKQIQIHVWLESYVLEWKTNSLSKLILMCGRLSLTL